MSKTNHPKHYNQYPIETIEMMVRVFGKERVKDFCLINAFKYRMRLGLKDDIQTDLEKEKWYLEKAEELANSARGRCLEEAIKNL